MISVNATGTVFKFWNKLFSTNIKTSAKLVVWFVFLPKTFLILITLLLKAQTKFPKFSRTKVQVSMGLVFLSEALSCLHNHQLAYIIIMYTWHYKIKLEKASSTCKLQASIHENTAQFIRRHHIGFFPVGRKQSYELFDILVLSLNLTMLTTTSYQSYTFMLECIIIIYFYQVAIVGKLKCCNCDLTGWTVTSIFLCFLSVFTSAVSQHATESKAPVSTA